MTSKELAAVKPVLEYLRKVYDIKKHDAFIMGGGMFSWPMVEEFERVVRAAESEEILKHYQQTPANENL